MSFKNPKYFGPGYWISWHLQSYKANNYDKKCETARGIVIDISGLPCSKCKEDSIEYVKNNPLMNVVKNKDKLSLFKWTVDFHNHVNRKLNKDLLNFEQAKLMYSDEGMCTEDCDQVHENDVNEDKEMSIKFF